MVHSCCFVPNPFFAPLMFQNDMQGVGITIPAVIGAMSKKVDDCALFMKAVSVPKHFHRDLNVPQMVSVSPRISLH